MGTEGKQTKKIGAFRVPRKDNYSGCYVTSQWVTNGHWMFDIAWLSECKTKARPVLRFLKYLRMDVVCRKLDGENVRDLTEQIKNITPAAEYLTENYESIDVSISQYVPPVENYDAYYILKNKDFPRIAVASGYFPALCFDKRTEVRIHKTDKCAPIALLKNNEVVGLIMPLRIPVGTGV